MQHLIAKDDHSTALQVFRELDDDEEMVSVAQKMLTHAHLIFHHFDTSRHVIKDALKSDLPIVLFLKGVATILRHNKTIDANFVDDFCDSADEIGRRYRNVAEASGHLKYIVK